MDIGQALQLAAQSLAKGELAQVERLCVAVLQAAPTVADAWSLRANALAQGGNGAAALDCATRACQLAPNEARFHHTLGFVHEKRKAWDEALAAYSKAIKLGGLGNFLSRYNRGVILRDLGRWSEAADAFRAAAKSKPDFHPAHGNLGKCLRELGKLDEAEKSLREALRLKPDYPMAGLDLAGILLGRGKMKEGWALFENRFAVSDVSGERYAAHRFDSPLWRGEDVAGKKVLLVAEFGLGDTVHFIRYAPLLARMGATVLVRCQTPALRLVRAVEGVSMAVDRDEDVPAHHLHIPMMSLPVAFGTDIDTVPAEVPYVAPPVAVPAPEGRAGAPKVGIVWNSGGFGPAARNCPLKHWAPVMELAHVDFYGLQYGPEAAEEIRQTGLAVTPLGEQIADIADTAALIAHMDVVISVDTSTAHLAGAMAKPTLVLLHDWVELRWMLERPDSPWYPTATLFRRKGNEPWEAVTARVRDHLAKVLPSRA